MRMSCSRRESPTTAAVSQSQPCQPVMAMAGVALVDVRDVAEMDQIFITPEKAVTGAAAWLVTAGEV